MKKIIVCVNFRKGSIQPSCAARGSLAIADQIEAQVLAKSLGIKVERFKCLGRCEEGPNLRLAPAGDFFHGVNLQDLDMILSDIERFISE